MVSLLTHICVTRPRWVKGRCLKNHHCNETDYEGKNYVHVVIQSLFVPVYVRVPVCACLCVRVRVRVCGYVCVRVCYFVRLFLCLSAYLNNIRTSGVWELPGVTGLKSEVRLLCNPRGQSRAFHCQIAHIGPLCRHRYAISFKHAIEERQWRCAYSVRSIPNCSPPRDKGISKFAH